ncbi:MAG: hypothetical protein M1370_04120 [Bacteroidetes bacterium]|nr:hypothetical protein [Bacteroidota bacterium]
MTPQQAAAASEAQAASGTVSGIMVFTPSESKRLIAKAVAQLPEVKAALKKGRIIIANGTTNAFVAEEITGQPVHKSWYTRGHVIDGGLASNKRHPNLLRSICLVDGKSVEAMPEEVLKEFDAGDVMIKGGNALDLEGNVGVIIGGPVGGTVGMFAGIVGARGSHLIAPIGLEKLVPSVPDAARTMGLRKLKYPVGGTVGMLIMPTAKVVTEIEALDILAGVEATHVASGGIGGSEGAVLVTIEGSEAQVAKAYEIVNSIKGEPPVPHPGKDMSQVYDADHPSGQ